MRHMMKLLLLALAGIAVLASQEQALSFAPTTPAAKPPAGGDKLGRCKNCVYVMERIKQGYHYLLPNICEEILAKTKLDAEYADCHKLLAGLSKWGLDVRHWLHNGCYKVEPYGAMSLVQPCPSHVICSKVRDLDDQPFCDEVVTDFNEKAPTAKK